ncbi:MAG TPA: alanine racemase [Mariprofundaceae bacterium]|nr:alanine racemase [Mariprofundaceae bacterium]
MSRPAIAHIDLDNLRHNYRLLDERAGKASVMAIVKADAYGHGLDLVAPALFAAGCRHFGVTDATEGARLRALLPPGAEAAIYPLSGIFDAEDAKLATENALIPVIAEPAQAGYLQQAGFADRVWIKVDTGMGRLGSHAPAGLAEACRRHGMRVEGILSHLACADEPEHPLNAMQADQFLTMLREFPEGTRGSLLNSAGMQIRPDMAADLVRPGIALYGAEPIPGWPMGLRPVMRLTGQVMQVREIPEGRSVSYGASFTAPETMPVAVVCLGYADGLPRGLSNRGAGIHGDARLPIVGRVCMDYVILDARNAPSIRPGDAVEFWGEALLANEVAASLDTIAYTLFTGVGHRVARKAHP